jgi:hypothetical protein
MIKATAQERMRLRELAARQAEIASLPVMKEREKLWYALNDGEARHPLVTFAFDGPPDEIYALSQSPDPVVAGAENQMAMNIANHTLLNDDRVIRPCLAIRVRGSFKAFGLEIEKSVTQYAGGGQSIGFAYANPVRDLEADFGKLGKSVWSIQAELQKAMETRDFLQDLLGDILPVRLEFPSFVFGFACEIFRIMGMENMLLSLYDSPDLFKKAMAMLRDDIMEYMDEIEASGALLPNGDGSYLNQDSWGYTHSLPAPGELSRPLGFRDVWGYTESQETVNISADMFDEFFFAFSEPVCRRFGLLSYGCCEPVHSFWDKSLSRLANLRKLSISPWCDERRIAERIRGKGIVYHRKPSPNYVGVDDVFDPEALGRHIAETCRAASGCPLEVTFRDVITCKGEPWRMGNAVAVVREQFARHWRP